MLAGRRLQLIIISVAAVLIVAACENGATDDETTLPDPTSTPTPTAAIETPDDDEAAGQPEPAEIPCEVRQLEPPPEDAPETDPERREDWLETSMSFNDLTIGQDGDFYIGSYRHASVLVLDEDRELETVWSEGVRNTQPQIETHPDGRILLLQDDGLHFFEPDGTHQKYISMLDFDAEFIPQYSGLGVTNGGQLYIGLERGDGLLKIDEECRVLGHWSNEDPRAPLMVAVDDDDRTYAVRLGLGESWVDVRDQDGALVDERHIEAPVPDTFTASVTDHPDGGFALLWVVPEDQRDPDPQSRIVEDFVVQHHAPDGDLIQEWYASESGAPEQLSAPRGMTIGDDGTVHIVDQGVGPDWMRMHSFDADGQFIEEWRLESDEALCAAGDIVDRIADCDNDREPEPEPSPAP